ncbi:homeobox protein 5 isoform X1 [Drosophila eugracilis]|uniref:homeobox protein 5 isoform X1 n=1 Tax=Drosophila eugracilis TaxID=29029 RepID=UPI0007E743A0|nr:homeobox protein 5 isoform X1 [Drosophila eugracilis]
MAVFMINVCKYNGCGITFPSLSDLISHIEDTHIDYDPKVVEQKEQAQPACLPLSYVLRFITEENRKEAGSFLASNTTAPPTSNSGSNSAGHGNGNVELKRKLAIKHHSYSMSSSNRSTTPTGSEMDEDEMVVTESEDSNDSWTTEEFSSEFIMRYGSRHSGGGNNGTPGNEKPFACPVPGCKKRYKNVNGIKYHSKNGHKKDGRVRKGYKCHCGKSYKTAQGLKNHALHTHNSQPDSVLNAQLANALAIGDGGSSSATPVGISNSSTNPNPPPVIQRSNSPSQSLGSLSPSSISNMSSSASSCHGGSSSLSNGNNNNNGNNGSNTSNTAILTGNGNVLQQLSAGNVVTLTNLPTQQPQQQQQLHQNTATGNSNNNLMRSTLGLVSIKANNTPTAKSVSNLMAANATASKILKLATNVANGGSSMDIVQQQQQQSHNKTTANGQTVLNGSKPLPNLVNLGILTPATSPTKNTQTLTFTTTNGSSQQQQALVASLAKKTNILLLQEPNQLLQQVQQQQQQHQQQQQQVQQQHHVLPISPTSSISGNSSKSSSPTPQQQQQQLMKKGKLELIEPMDTDEGQSDGISESVAAAIASITDCKEEIGGATVAGIEVVGAGAVNEET